MNEDNSKKAFEVHSEIVQNEKMRRVLLAKNSQLLSEMLQDDNFRLILGDESAPWSAYLGQIETYYSRSKANALIRVFRKMHSISPESVVMYADIPTTRMTEILPILDIQNCAEWLEKARTLVRKDWDIEVRKAKGKITQEDEHEHEMISYQQCEKCGLKIKANETHTHHDEGEYVRTSFL